MNPILVADLFSGAGGLTLGFERAGFQTAVAYEKWEPAAATFQANFGNIVKCLSINSGLEIPKTNVIIGGPPCQGFSSAGMRRSDDQRNNLVRVFSEIVARIKPDAFVFENVEGFLTASEGNFLFDLISPLVDVGYRIHIRKINAANFGVPQHRKRVVAIGGLGWDPSFPEFTHMAIGAPGSQLACSAAHPLAPTLSDALLTLPRATIAAENTTENHSYTPLCGDDLKRASLLKPGERMRDLPEELWHESYKRRAFRRVKDGTPTERRGGAPSGLRRLNGGEPSKTITGGALSEFIHPFEDRPLTISECAALQTFPKSFKWCGNQNEIIQQIGNAVPPMLAEHIARSIHKDLAIKKRVDCPGALLSFVPTLSNGMSPVLKKVMSKINHFTGKQAVIKEPFLWD